MFFSFTLRNSATVSLKIYSLSGELRRVILDRSYFFQGTYAETWNGRDDKGQFVTPRPYLCILTVDDEERVINQNLTIAADLYTISLSLKTIAFRPNKITG